MAVAAGVVKHSDACPLAADSTEETRNLDVDGAFDLLRLVAMVKSVSLE